MKRRKFLTVLGIGAVAPILPKIIDKTPEVPLPVMPELDKEHHRKMKRLSSQGICGDEPLMGNEEMMFYEET